MSKVVSSIVDTVKSVVHEVTGYDDVKEAEERAKKRQQEIIEARKEAEDKRKAAEEKKRKEMRARVKEQASRLGHSGNVVAGKVGGGTGLLSNSMNPFAGY